MSPDESEDIDMASSNSSALVSTSGSGSGSGSATTAEGVAEPTSPSFRRFAGGSVSSNVTSWVTCSYSSPASEEEDIDDREESDIVCVGIVTASSSADSVELQTRSDEGGCGLL